MSAKIKISFSILILALIGFGFQNCSQVDFGKDDAKSVQQGVDGAPADEGQVIGNMTIQEEQSPGPIPACNNSSCNDSLTNPKTLNTKGRLVEVGGSCISNIEDIKFSGDVLNITETETGCDNGKFKHCILIKKHYEQNEVIVKQRADEVKFNILLNAPPVVTLTMDSFVMKGSKGVVTGKCLPSAVLEFTIYNQVQNKTPVICSGEGTYKFEGVTILTGQKIRKLYVKQISSSAPTKSIYFDLAQPGLVPSCGFKSFTPSSKICSGEAGKVQGTCLAGLPVLIHINGHHQNTAFCTAQGTFSIDDLLFSDTSAEKNKLSISQITPFGQKCEFNDENIFE